MAVASLDMSLTDFRNHACAELFAGGSTDYDDLDVGEQTDIDRLILRGERTFWLHPPGVDQPHVWSCLRDPGLLDLWGTIAVDAAVTVSGGAFASGVTTITATAASFYETMIGKSIVITTIGTFVVSAYTSSTVIVVTGDASTAVANTFSIASDGTYRLPSDFESPESSTIEFTGTDSYRPEIQLVNEKYVTAMRATQAQTGYPSYAAIRWVTSDGSVVQAQELVTWATADAYYGVSLPYMAQPQGMSVANPYPRGGPEMADCLLSVILAVCDEHKTGQRGDRWQEAAEKCSAAARRDRSRHHNFIAGRMRPDAGGGSYYFDAKRLILPA